MEREDFTFPITTNNTNTKPSIDSKPWWSVTHSSSSSEKSENKEAEDLESCMAVSRTFGCCGRKSFEGIRGGAKVGNDVDNMDLLWEEFNEETMCRSCGMSADADMPSMRMAGLGCTAALKMVKTGVCRKPSAGVFIKALKMLLLQNDRPLVNRSTW
ncbi:hypothetical protein AgCh_026594 [Apium graveolens]